MDNQTGGNVSRHRKVLWKTSGSFIGSLAGGVSLAIVGLFLPRFVGPDYYGPGRDNNPDMGFFVSMTAGAVGLLIGTIIGSAAGAALTQRLMKQRGSFWKALLGAFVGLSGGGAISLLLIYAEWETRLSMTLYRLGLHLDSVGAFVAGFLIIDAFVVAGAVIGSGWGAKPVNVTQTQI